VHHRTTSSRCAGSNDWPNGSARPASVARSDAANGPGLLRDELEALKDRLYVLSCAVADVERDQAAETMGRGELLAWRPGARRPAIGTLPRLRGAPPGYREKCSPRPAS